MIPPIMRAGIPRCAGRVAFPLRRAIALLVASTACYHVRITESYWLRRTPGTLADSVLWSPGLPEGYSLERVSIAASDGVVLRGLLAKHPAAQTTVVYFGGSDFRVTERGVATIRRLGAVHRVSILLVDYRGYGESEGTPTMAKLKTDALAVVDFATGRRDLPPDGLLVHGHSMGSFIAGYIATERAVRALVLQGAATNVADWQRYFLKHAEFKWWAKPARPFIRFDVDSTLRGEDNRERLQRYRGPLLLLVGAADTATDPAMSLALFEVSATPADLKRLEILPGSGHEDLLLNPRFPSAYDRFLGLLESRSRLHARP